MATTPGLLFVTFQPEPSFPLAQFHDWYNNEHGPARLRLSYFKNGVRYRMRGDAKPDWMVIYHVSDVTGLLRPPYTTLREAGVKTERETEVMRHVEIKRGIFNHIYTKQARDITVREGGAVIVGERIAVPVEHDADFNRWYEEEHIPLLSKVAGWLRSRRYSTYSADGAHPAEYLALHEYDAENGIAGPDFQAALDTAWFHKVMGYAATKWVPMIWDSIYTFGPASRDLGALHDPSAYFFQSRDGKTVTWPIPGAHGSTSSAEYQESRYGGGSWPYKTPNWPAIRSFVTTEDGLDLPYQLEGSGDPQAPLIVLVNSILVDYRIWDAFAVSFLSSPANKHFRILRYNARGFSADAGSHSDATIDLLTADLLTLLDALNVPSAATAVGVSLGGATVLNAGLKHPDRVPAFVACDTNPVAPPNNAQAWAERLEVAGKENAEAASGEPIVGEQLAQMTSKRWFPRDTSDDSRLNEEIAKVTEMVKTSSRAGFKNVVKALYEYDLRPLMEDAKAKALFVVGGEDGVLPQTMAEMAQSYGNGAKVETVDGAGHLPMVDKPERMAEIVGGFANSL